jgi:L-malate glycosyltransferase
MPVPRSRLLLIVNQASHAGGAEVQLLHLANGLAGNGHEVVLCCIDRSFLEPGALASGIELVELGAETRGRRALAVPRLARLARDVDVVQCTMWDPSLWGRLAAIAARRPVIVADHATDRSVQVTVSGKPRANWIAMHNRLLDRFTFATVACASSQEEVLLGEGVSPRKIVHIPNGIPIAKIEKVAQGGPSRSSLGIPEDAPLAVQVGHFRAEKNQMAALDAFAKVREEVPTAQLAFVGTGPLREDVERRAAEFGAGEWVHFLGYRPDAVAVLALGDLQLLPSISDAMPMTVIEGMALGVPVVASDVGDVGAMLGDAGVCVPAGDVAALASQCVRLLGDAGLRSRMSDAGRERARAYDSAKMVARYEALFEAARDGGAPIAAVASADAQPGFGR